MQEIPVRQLLLVGVAIGVPLLVQTILHIVTFCGLIPNKQWQQSHYILLGSSIIHACLGIAFAVIVAKSNARDDAEALELAKWCLIGLKFVAFTLAGTLLVLGFLSLVDITNLRTSRFVLPPRSITN